MSPRVSFARLSGWRNPKSIPGYLLKPYDATIDYLYGLQSRGIKFGLRNVLRLLNYVGNPHRAFPSVHIAGTNGKGSTASFIASILMESGYRTALYTSPHLVRFTERIRIDGKEIPEGRLVEYVRLLRPAIEETGATFFESTTCAAFMYFADEEVDIAVLETGLGGRLDATNVVLPEVSVITTIGMDHMEYLGNTLRSVSREKGGIIKRGVPVVTSSREPVVVGVLRAIAGRKHSPFYRAAGVVSLSSARASDGLLKMRSRAFGAVRVRLGLGGPHQAENARLAVAALGILKRRRGGARRPGLITRDAIRRGLRNVRENTGLRGRLEIVRSRLCLDVAHNPDGIRVLLRALGVRGRRPRVVVFGAMKDKDWKAMLCELHGAFDRCILVAPRVARAASVGTLLRRARALGMNAAGATSVASGVRLARGAAGPRGSIVVTGSHYVVGEALASLNRRYT